MGEGPVVQHPQFGPAMPSLDWIPAPRYLLRRDRVLTMLDITQDASAGHTPVAPLVPEGPVAPAGPVGP